MNQKTKPILGPWEATMFAVTLLVYFIVMAYITSAIGIGV